MGYYDVMKSEMQRIYNALIDEESKDWFNARVEYMITRNSDAFLNSVFSLFRKYQKKCHHVGMERFVKDKDYRGVIIYGCGHDGKLTKEILNLCGYLVSFWCDSNQQIVGNKVNGLRVISTEELVEKYADYLVVIGSFKYMNHIKERLRSFGFPLDRVAIFSDNAYDWAVTGTQYFDMFEPGNKEIFIDGGAYNGDTIYDFMAWNKENAYKVYSFEPMKGMYELILKRLEKDNITSVNVLNSAVWDRKEELFFADMVDGSRVACGGSIKVNGERIDDIVGTDEVTFIKLDVEGAELEALKGASETIQMCHPKLAICIYHKPTDILDIGKYILELSPDYKLAIRHYTLSDCETVLYAIP
ncbi:MAG: FkbM family methyltransferase [Lachnospiraceae bacterium]|nr:FkbM family methyltransferase [Lachnospiraceae bacterium]